MKTKHSSSPVSQAFQRALRDRLIAMDYPTFSNLMQTLLERSGYVPVQKTERQFKRGRTKSGGLDIRAYIHTDLASCLTLVQIKQYRHVVSRRFVDELRGAMVRLSAEQGLLLSTSTFSRVAHRAAAASELVPIRLIDGAGILKLLVQHRIGVKPGRWGWLRIDADFFDKLQEKSRSTGEEPRPVINTHRKSTRKRSQPSQPRIPEEPTVPTNRAALSAAGGEMQWRTHVLIGLNSLWLFELLPRGLEQEHLPLMLGAAAFGSLLPDLDAAQSKIKHLSAWGIKPFLLPSVAIYRTFGHRGFLHSVSALILTGLVSIPLSLYLGWQTGMALVLGYGAHLAADACTKSGIPFWYVPFLHPDRRRCHLLPPRLRFATGSEAELALFPVLGLLLLLLLLRHLSAGDLQPPQDIRTAVEVATRGTTR